MAGSSAEREIRTAIADWFREREPSARIVHELNVSTGKHRADLGIIFPDFLVLIEIKSEKDKLARLEDQFKAFQRCSHHALIVAHDKHFEGDGLKNQPWMVWSHKEHLWSYPAPESGQFKWKFDRYKGHIQPNAYGMLDLLWAEELRAECSRHGVNCSEKTARWGMCRDLQLLLTGDEIRKAVCRQLRSRAFAEADAPIYEVKAAA